MWTHYIYNMRSVTIHAHYSIGIGPARFKILIWSKKNIFVHAVKSQYHGLHSMDNALVQYEYANRCSHYFDPPLKQLNNQVVNLQRCHNKSFNSDLLNYGQITTLGIEVWQRWSCHKELVPFGVREDKASCTCVLQVNCFIVETHYKVITSM